MNWTDFFVATAGAAAALTGLIFVGVSISLVKILSIASLPDRALLSLVLLLAILIISLLFLVPDLSQRTSGIEVLISGGIVWTVVTRLDILIFRKKDRSFKRLYLFNIIIDQVAVLPYLLCGIFILYSGNDGMYWIVPAFLFSFIKAVVDAWVLLVEINR